LDISSGEEDGVEDNLDLGRGVGSAFEAYGGGRAETKGSDGDDDDAAYGPCNGDEEDAAAGGHWAMLALICPGARQPQPSLDWEGGSSDGDDGESGDEAGPARGRFAFGGLGPADDARGENPGRPARGPAGFFASCLPPPAPETQPARSRGFVWPWQRATRQ